MSATISFQGAGVQEHAGTYAGLLTYVLQRELWASAVRRRNLFSYLSAAMVTTQLGRELTVLIISAASSHQHAQSSDVLVRRAVY